MIIINPQSWSMSICDAVVISGCLHDLQTRLHSSVPRSSETEEVVEALQDENRSLKSQLEEAKRGVSRLTKEKDELARRLEERDLEREALRRGKGELEEQKRLLDRALEKISKEVWCRTPSNQEMMKMEMY